MTTKEIIYCEYSGLPSPLTYVQPLDENKRILTIEEINRVIEMAWEDRTTFDAIREQFGLNESAVKALMKKSLKFSSYKLWRQRVENCNTKHKFKRVDGITKFKCNLQRSITSNKISKRKR